jgi:hypothetical protein
MSRAPPGWVPERSIGHAWKACVPKGTEGSNPSPSAGQQIKFFKACRLALFVRVTEIRTPFDRWGALRAGVESEAQELEPKHSFG